VRDHFLTQGGEAFRAGFLADAFREALRHCRMKEASESDREILERVLVFLKRVRFGYMAAVPAHRAADAELHLSVKDTSAFRYAVQAWNRMPNPPAVEEIDSRLDKYVAAITGLLKGDCGDDDVLGEIEDFFALIGRSTLGEVKQQATWDPGTRLHVLSEIQASGRLQFQRQ